jgi:glycosyltransferase involved in cell wall biosynthesis
MRIALVSINAWPLIGGVEKNAHRLAQTLQARGDSCRMITRFCQSRTDLAGYFRDTEPIRSGLIDGVATDVIPLRTLERVLWIPLFRLIWRRISFPLAVALHNLVMVPKLERRLRDAQIIHFLGTGPELMGFAAASTARRLRIPLVVEPALHPGQWGDSWIDRRLYQQADRVLAHSQAESKVLQQLGIALKNIEVVTHGVDWQEGGSDERFRRNHDIAANAPLILFLGRKTKQKGVYRILQAFQTVHHTLPDALLVLAGPTAEDLNLDLEKASNVLNLHQLSEADKQDALAACTLLCVPSEGESFGLVYYEAWQYRKPVVALDLPCLRESIAAHSAGLLVPAEQPDALSEALLTLLDSPKLAAQMGQRGYDLANRHSWNQAISSYQDVYRQLVNQ